MSEQDIKNTETPNGTDEATPDLQKELEIARAEASEWQDKFLRKLAEFDNYRRRTRQETEMLRQVIAEAMVATLVPIMDDFDRTLAHCDANDPLQKGVEMIRGKFAAFFESQGVQRFDPMGKPFDPNEHDALMMQPTPDFPAGTVLGTILPGYRMSDRIIRHAQVIVSAEVEGKNSGVEEDTTSYGGKDETEACD